MTITIDKAGRIIVPKEFRRRLGLRPNTELEIVDHPDGLLLRVPESRPSLVKVNGLLVHQGRLEDGADLDRLLDSVREERIQEIIRG
ncbi:MAG TPA: AbrB/MazE/SpoVT family DNA-binding domain-containing protein [Terriglobales bacterium]|nr:AbrB/MazE/SpoVT family DNA-binding domain-containing protein [Terriglobales bacterium]